LQLAKGILERCDLADFALFVQIARQVWFQRNRWVHDGIFKHPKSIIQETAMHMEESNLIHEQNSTEKDVGTNASAVRWSAPSQGRYKANWDMAIDKAHGRVGIGVVMRDEKGRVVAAMSKTRMGTLEPIAGEALAAYHV
jgi:isoaspartyl peptidase/L-asparaginase-like protein (Ntn-hydrolase superfamily)